MVSIFIPLLKHGIHMMRTRRFLLPRAVAAALAAPGLAGCPGDGPVEPRPAAVASVTLSPDAVTLRVGEARTLAATPRDAGGAPLAGRTVAWASSNPAVAEVDGNGAVRGVAPGGPVTITATSEGQSGTAQVTVTLVPVASVRVVLAADTIFQGSTHPLAATALDSAGNVLAGYTAAWTSSDATVAAVDAAGQLSAVAAGGPVTITATLGGVAGSLQVTVAPRIAARVSLAPSFTAVAAGGSAQLRAAAFDAAEVEIPDPVTHWGGGGAIAAVSQTGSVTGTAVGIAAVTARVDAAADSAWVAVVEPQGLLSTAFARERVKTAAAPGDTLTVAVVLDLSRAAADGDLGSAQFDLAYDPAVLSYVSAEGVAAGSSTFDVPTPGTFKFAFAATAPQTSATVTLVQVRFRVAAGAPVGAQRVLTLTYTAPPTSTTFASYPLPVGVGGRIRVGAP